MVDHDCPYRRELEDVRRLVGEMYGRLQRLANGAQAKPRRGLTEAQHAAAHMMTAFDAASFPTRVAEDRVKGLEGTPDEILRQALAASDSQRSFS